MTQGLVAIMLATGLAVAHAQESPTGAGVDIPLPGRLDLVLHAPRHAGLATPGALGVLQPPVVLHGSARAPGHVASEHRLAPGVELLAGYDPYTVFDALDFKPRAGEYALSIKLDF